MNERERMDWQRFAETGRIVDYLRYRGNRAQREDDPRRRIETVTKNRKFY